MTLDREVVGSGNRDIARTVGAAHLAFAGVVNGALALALARFSLSGRLLELALATAPRYMSEERLLQVAPLITTLANEGALAVSLFLAVAAVALVGAGRASWNARFRRRWLIATVPSLLNPLVAPLVVVGLVLTYLTDTSVTDSEGVDGDVETSGQSGVDMN
jgi:hypothetical protein